MIYPPTLPATQATNKYAGHELTFVYCLLWNDWTFSEYVMHSQCSRLKRHRKDEGKSFPLCLTSQPSSSLGMASSCEPIQALSLPANMLGCLCLFNKNRRTISLHYSHLSWKLFLSRSEDVFLCLVIFEFRSCTSDRGACEPVGMDSLFLLSSQMGMRLPGCSETASEADLDHCARSVDKASKPLGPAHRMTVGTTTAS